jgi:uncharacterized membrane protein HdeD (DUF308 family)
MSEPAHLAGMLACGGRHRGSEPACGTITLLAAIAVLAWPGETLPVAAVLRGIQLIAAGPVKFAAAFHPCSTGHVAVHPISQP